MASGDCRSKMTINTAERRTLVVQDYEQHVKQRVLRVISPIQLLQEDLIWNPNVYFSSTYCNVWPSYMLKNLSHM